MERLIHFVRHEDASAELFAALDPDFFEGMSCA